MKTFKSLCVLFKPVGISPKSANENLAFNIRNIIVFALFLQWTIFSWTFFIFKAQTIAQFIESFYFSITTMVDVLMFPIIIWKMTKIFDFIDDFGRLIDKRFKYLESKAIYEQVNEKVVKWTKIVHFMFTSVTIPGVMIPNCVISYFLYFTTDLGSEAFRTPFLMWFVNNPTYYKNSRENVLHTLTVFPFDWKTPFGYILAFIVQLASAYCLCVFVAFMLTFFLASCWTLMAVTLDIKCDFNHFNDIAKSERNNKKLKQKLSVFIMLNVDAKELARDLINIFKFIITMYFFWSTSTSRAVVNPLGLIEPLVLEFWSFIEILMLCNFGEMVINRFSEINDVISTSDWYLFPLETQRMLPTILMNTQHSIQFRGFGNIELSRDTFKRVVNGGFSYFMVLRGFKN